MLILTKESPRILEAIDLVNAANAELKVRYPEEGVCGAFHLEDGEGEGKAFLVARWNGRPVGCGAIRPFADGVAEVKRMFVRKEARGQGIGRSILARLEQEAVQDGYRALVLETGTRQPEAVALYESAGYERIPCWAEYHGNPFSLCYKKDLGPSPKL